MLTWEQIKEIDKNYRLPKNIIRCDAVCPITGISLRFSHGRTRKAPKFYVFMPDIYISHYADYNEWRYGSRAWSVDEAIEKALNNKKVQGWYQKAWDKEFNKLICDG